MYLIIEIAVGVALGLLLFRMLPALLAIAGVLLLVAIAAGAIIFLVIWARGWTLDTQRALVLILLTAAAMAVAVWLGRIFAQFRRNEGDWEITRRIVAGSIGIAIFAAMEWFGAEAWVQLDSADQFLEPVMVSGALMLSGPFVGYAVGVGLISVPKVPVETPCFSRAPAPPLTQVIDYVWGSVPGKTPKSTEENSVEKVNLASEFGRNSCRNNDISQ